MRRAWLIAGLTIAAAGAVGAAVLIPRMQKENEARTLDGSLTITSQLVHLAVNEGAPCNGLEGYDDVQGGLDVVVKNEDSKIVATGALGTGRAVGARTSTYEPIKGLGVQTTTTYSCVFNWSVAGVPHAAFYTVEIGRRGGGTFSFDELQARGWNLMLSLTR